MKKLNETRKRGLMFLAFGILALISVIITLSTDLQTGLGLTTAFAIMIGGVELTGKEEALYNALTEHITKQKEKYDKEYITEAAMLKSITDKMKELKFDLSDNDEFKKLKDAMIAQGLVLTSLKERGGEAISSKTLGQQWKEYVTGAGKEEWESLKAKRQNGLSFTAKVAANMLPSTNITGTIPQGQREPGMTDVARETRFLMDVIGTTPAQSSTIEYVEKVNPDGTATFIADTASFAQIDFDLSLSTSTAKDVGAIITVHENMLNDIDFIAGEIDRELIYQIRLAADNEIIAGTGLTVHLKGITVAAPAGFSLISISVVEPNNGDCISAAIRQIEILGFNTAPSILIAVNPADYENLVGTKDTNGQYVKHPLMSQDGMLFAGYPIFRSSQITAGMLLVFDKMKVNTKVLQDITLASGYNLTGEFAKRLMTIRGYMRLHNYIKANDVNSFVYDSFADIKAAITSL